MSKTSLFTKIFLYQKQRTVQVEVKICTTNKMCYLLKQNLHTLVKQTNDWICLKLLYLHTVKAKNSASENKNVYNKQDVLFIKTEFTHFNTENN